MFQWLTDILKELLGGLAEGAVELLVIGGLLLIVFVLTLPIYFVMKKFKLGPERWHTRETTLMEDIREARAWRGPSLEEYGRSSFVKQVDEVQIGLQTVYQYFLWFVLVASTVFIVYF